MEEREKADVKEGRRRESTEGRKQGRKGGRWERRK